MKLTDQNKVSIVAIVSLLCLVVVFKNVLHQDASFIIIFLTGKVHYIV